MSQEESASREYGIPPSTGGLPDGTRLGGVRLLVSDLRRSRAYYEQVLGLRALSETAGSVALGSAGSGTPLVTLEERPGVRPAGRGAFGLYHFAILLPDRAALGRFASHVSGLGLRVGMADHLVSEALYLWDPDGLGIEVYADRPRSTWQHRNRELLMTTDPLDVRQLIADAAGTPWDGAPAGTTMGHVHLHVGNLEEADRFYHEALGFDRMVWSYPGALFLAAGGYHHHLGTNVWAPGPSAPPDTAQLLEWQVLVDGDDPLSGARKRLERAGQKVEPTARGFIATDPWGTRVHVMTAPARQ